MSLLEDVFLQDEAGEAQELERVIEGDDYDGRPRASSPDSDDNSVREDEAEEDKKRVDPTESKQKRVIKNPRFILNPARLTGPRGIQVIPEHFKDFKFKGKGNEKEDLDMVLKKLEHWAYRLYPKFQFEDCLKKIETLGKKRPVMVHLHKIRSDQFVSEEVVVQRDSSDEEAPAPAAEEDEFDKLLQQQIDIARATPVHKAQKPDFGTPRHQISPLAMPKATSSPSISDQQRERMLQNKRLAEERRLAKLKKSAEESIEIDHKIIDTQSRKSKNNYSDSSDNECDLNVENRFVVADVHDTRKSTKNDDKVSVNDVEVTDNTDLSDVTKAKEVVTIIENNGPNKDTVLDNNLPDKDTNEGFDNSHAEIDKDHDRSEIPGKDVEKSHCDEIDLVEVHDNGEDSMPNDTKCEVDNLADEDIMDIDFSDNF